MELLFNLSTAGFSCCLSIHYNVNRKFPHFPSGSSQITAKTECGSEQFLNKIMEKKSEVVSRLYLNIFQTQPIVHYLPNILPT